MANKNFIVKNGLTVGGVDIVNSSGVLTQSLITTVPSAAVVTTQAVGNSSTRIASTAYVRGEIDALIDSAPGTLNTLDELAAAINDDAQFNTTLTDAVALKAPLASPTFTGNVSFPDDTIDLAHMSANSVDSDQYVDGSIDAAHLAPAQTNITSLGTLTGLTLSGNILMDGEEQNDFKIKWDHGEGTSHAGISTVSQTEGVSLTLGSNAYHAASGGVVVSDTNNQSMAITLDGFNSNNIKFMTAATGNPADRMVIDSTGNVGIGGHSPVSLLHLRNSSTASYPLLMEGDIDNDGGYTGIQFGYNGGSYTKAAIHVEGTSGNVQPEMHFLLNSAASSQNTQGLNDARLSIINNGNVGIGTTSPGYPLEVAHGTPEFSLEDTSSSATFRFKLDGTEATIKNHGTNGHLALLTTGTGNVGIGTTTPDERLHVYEGSAGSVTANAAAQVVIENSGDAGINLLSPNSDDNWVMFGDPDDSFVGGLRYRHSTNNLHFYTNNSDNMMLSSAGQLSGMSSILLGLSKATDATVSSSDPTATSNPSAVGHLWINSTSGENFVCTTATSNANYWTNVGDGTGDVTPYLQGIAYTAASGGGSVVNPTTVGDYKVWTFLGPSANSYTGGTMSFVVTQANTVDILLVAGGGGGSQDIAGGGGAGGVLQISSHSLAIGTYNIVIGSGGNQVTSGVHATAGGNTTALGYTAIGGGPGSGSVDSGFGNTEGDGGSGGGGGNGKPHGAGTAGPPRQGYDGEDATGNAGGGGAGEAGGTDGAGAGGDGVQNSWRTGSNVYYGGGGSGSASGSGGGGVGGVGGGGTGSTTAGYAGAFGDANTGGGGAAHYGAWGGAGKGGTGIVVIRAQFQ